MAGINTFFISIIGYFTRNTDNLQKDFSREKMTKTQQARIVGVEIARKALEAGITAVVFDRNGFLYHGRVKALADAARENGLIF